MSKVIEFVQCTMSEMKEDLMSKSSVLGKAIEHHVLVDIGASNCRVSIVPNGLINIDKISYINFKASSSSTLRKGFESLVATIGKEHFFKVRASCTNSPAPANGMIAGPLSNYEGPISEKMIDLMTMPVELFPRDRTMLLNDLEACAFGICAACEMHTFSNLFSLMWPASSKSPTTPWKNDLGEGHCVVIAPGTGLGAALIQWHPNSESYTVLALEMGHLNVVEFPNTKEFVQEYAHELQEKRGGQIVYDDICSGRGLERCYKYVSKGQIMTAENIGIAAGKKDEVAVKAMRLYNGILMHFANQMSMGFQPRTIIICGDNTTRNRKFYDDKANIESMKEYYNAHCMERFGFMSKVHMVRQSVDVNMNIMGCAYVAERSVAKTFKI